MPLIDMSELNGDDDFAEVITLRRPGVPSVANEGVVTPMYLPDQKIVATVQPASDADLKQMPEGANLTDVVAVYGATALRIADQSGVQSDVLIRGSLPGGKFYRVTKIEDRQKNGYTKALAERFEP